MITKRSKGYVPQLYTQIKDKSIAVYIKTKMGRNEELNEELFIFSTFQRIDKTNE